MYLATKYIFRCNATTEFKKKDIDTMTEAIENDWLSRQKPPKNAVLLCASLKCICDTIASMFGLVYTACRRQVCLRGSLYVCRKTRCRQRFSKHNKLESRLASPEQTVSFQSKWLALYQKTIFLHFEGLV